MTPISTGVTRRRAGVPAMSLHAAATMDRKSGIGWRTRSLSGIDTGEDLSSAVNSDVEASRMTTRAFDISRKSRACLSMKFRSVKSNKATD